MSADMETPPLRLLDKPVSFSSKDMPGVESRVKLLDIRRRAKAYRQNLLNFEKLVTKFRKPRQNKTEGRPKSRFLLTVMPACF
jgi:hypothetical protein